LFPFIIVGTILKNMVPFFPSFIYRFGNKSYLSVGEMVLPYLFFCFSLLYAMCLYLWFSNIRFIKNGKSGYFDIGNAPSAGVTMSGNKFIPATPTIYPIHYLMGFLLTLKTLSLFFESIRYHYLGVTGHAVFFSAVYYTFAFLKVSRIRAIGIESDGQNN